MHPQTYLSRFVSLHPYFQVQPGKLEEFKAGMHAMVERTRAEEKNLFYDFTVRDHEVLCREAYTDAAGLLTHLGNVDALLKQALQIAKLTRLEVHGPAAELDQLRGPMGDLQPTWFAYECGV